MSGKSTSGKRLIIAMGTGRCGHRSLATLMNRQKDTGFSYQEPPLLPWRRREGSSPLNARLERFQFEREHAVVGDVSTFYLPYLEDAMTSHPQIRVVCLKRPREEVVTSMCSWLDKVYPFPTDHWSRQPSDGFSHDPFWTRIFPQYDSTNREDGIRQYWHHYYDTAERIAARYPQNMRIFDYQHVLNTELGQREMLDFCGYSSDEQVIALGIRENDSAAMKQRPTKFSNDPQDPRRCVVIVPYNMHIMQRCDEGLKQLERQGYTVWRVEGFAAIDQGRNQLATDALREGFAETMWIDSDVAFPADSVNQLRSCELPIVCGIYPQKGRRAIACHLIPHTPNLTFGKEGGLKEVLYAATGFLHVRRQVYVDVQHQLQLPMCNERFGRLMIPFFLPMPHHYEDGYWYLAEDYAFSQRVRECGYKIMADSRIRLWHIGNYPYSWEDAGMEAPRYDTFLLKFGASDRDAAQGRPPPERPV